MKVLAPAKVNIALNITGILEDGYHALDMIMAPISLYDEIEIEPSSKEEDEILFEGMEVPQNNTVAKAIAQMRATFALSNHYKVKVKKNIPSQAGLGGGSADAAAIMKAIDQMEQLDLGLDRLIEVGKQVGADVPFCLVNAWARVKGFGEQIEPLDSDWKFNILLVKPKEGISTPQAFKLWDDSQRYQYDIDLVETALLKKSDELLYTTMGNALEDVAQDVLPVLKEIKEDMYNEGIVQAMMSGSGSSIMGFSVDESVLEEAKKALEAYYDFVEVVTVG